MRIAVMQPYFVPYAGYFRLLRGADAFVVYDAAQFPRRGWVHRNRLRTGEGTPAWLTLPVARAPVETPIRSLRFSAQAASLWAAQCRRFPACREPRGAAMGLMARLTHLEGSVADYNVGLLQDIARTLDLSTPILRLDPGLGLPPTATTRTGRLVAICEHFGATRCINAPGGRALYDPAEFARRGLQLSFLPDYRGSLDSILQRLNDETPRAVRREIDANM
jgi:hypothetical protein